MNVFIHYLKDRRFYIYIYIVSIFVCWIVFKLYHLELEALFYALLILLMFLLVCMSIDFYRYKLKHKQCFFGL